MWLTEVSPQTWEAAQDLSEREQVELTQLKDGKHQI